ncbi:hypothetical protein FHR24_001898 [Wenyingzhuangia heitensis]|uniref:Nucleotide-diphospho-sugar transferase n=1 Tax=Wenyingzhuangia heitensis TaxID=1487859 RepID=A0ABX0UC87_9FLAO|nr:hypothetical protein [Wenyingzhuangia heitensis]NIJ45430.1 hypothetical protein [Wenyingzhuangia heitensis]
MKNSTYKAKTAILSTVNNFDLYKKSSALYPADIPSYVIDGRNGMFGIHSIVYMMKIFKNKDIDWLILMDEDALFINSDKVFPLIEYMAVNDYMISGMRDGGMLPERSGSPYSMNPYFSVINLKKLKEIWNKKEMLENHYIKDDEFDDDLSGLKYTYDKKSMSEPYYGFYFWLKRKGMKLLYLDISLPFKEDQITNIVHDIEGDPILYHTWFSREYGDKRGRHTARINKVFEEFKLRENTGIAPIIYKDSLFPLKDRFRRFKKNTRKRFRNLGIIK